MKKHLAIIILSALFVLAFAFFFFNSNSSFTGFVVYDNSMTPNISVTNTSAGTELIVTRDQALKSINESQNIIREFDIYGFSIVYINDSLTEALRLFKQAEYADILKNPNSTTIQQNEARKVLSLVNIKTISYASVLKYTEDIKSRKEQAFQIYDTISIDEISLKKYEKRGIDMSESRALFNQAKSAFAKDQYPEALDLLKKTRESIDARGSEASILGSLKANTLNFIQRNWYYILAVIVVLYILIKIFYKKLELRLLKNKIKKMKTEQQALGDLMKKTQTERYKENKISGLTYNIRIKKYEEKLNQIKEELPVLESRLKEYLKSSAS